VCSQRIKIPFIDRNSKKLFKTHVETGIVPDTEKIPVYNYVSSNQRPITWNTFRKHVRAHGSKIPGVKDIRLQCMFWNSRLWVHKIFVWLFHLLPAVMVDAAAILTGRDPRSGSLLFSPFFSFFFFKYILHTWVAGISRDIASKRLGVPRKSLRERERERGGGGGEIFEKL